MADISVLIPWRTDNGQRQRIFDRLLPLWQASGLDICVGEDDHGGLFNINRALNRARRDALGDVLVVMGADHIPDPDHLRAAVEAMGAWCMVYDRREVLTADATQAVLDGADPHRDWPTTTKASGKATGIVAVQAELWDDLGGRDERFTGWGRDDNAYLDVLQTLGGDGQAHRHTVRDLWHPPKVGVTRNHALARAYRKARGNPEAMREVLAGARHAQG